MKVLLLFVAWCLLFVLSWPLAIAAAILFPFVWLISLPVRLVITVVHAALAFVAAVLFLPARLLGWRRCA